MNGSKSEGVIRAQGVGEYFLMLYEASPVVTFQPGDARRGDLKGKR